MNNKKNAFLFISLYILGRMIAEPFFWSQFSPYYSYLFEILFVTASIYTFHSDFRWKKLPKKFTFIFLITFLTGLITFHSTKTLNLFVPFNFSSLDTVILLLIVAPILEEAIFRLALWDAFHQIIQNQYILILITTFLFMAGHLSAYWFVPAEYRAFVLFQSLYVIFLGLLAGFTRLKTSSVNGPILLHFAFNFGFFFSAKFWM